jgi:hypothetical protein
MSLPVPNATVNARHEVFALRRHAGVMVEPPDLRRLRGQV